MSVLNAQVQEWAVDESANEAKRGSAKQRAREGAHGVGRKAPVDFAWRFGGAGAPERIT